MTKFAQDMLEWAEKMPFESIVPMLEPEAQDICTRFLSIAKVDGRGPVGTVKQELEGLNLYAHSTPDPAAKSTNDIVITAVTQLFYDMNRLQNDSDKSSDT